MKTNQKSAILLGVKSAFSLLLLFLLTVVLHEGAHYIAALILGIPIAHFTWFDPSYFAPAFFTRFTEHTTRMMIVGYAGGLVTGILLLAILLLKRAWFKQSLYRWLLGFYVVMFGFWEICQGILEGAFHQAYISNATNLLFRLTHYIGYASAVLGMFLYWLLMPRLRELKV